MCQLRTDLGMAIVRPDTLPASDSLEQQFGSACEIRERLAQASSENVTVDISDGEWFTPGFLAPAAVAYQRNNQNCDRFHLPPDKERYLSHIDFPDGSSDPEKTHKNDLPLCQLNTSGEASTIERLESKIGKLLVKNFGGSFDGTVSAIRYPMSELIDNVDQHSRCENGALLVQNYPSKSFVEICVADDGMGIPGNYDRHGIEFDDHGDALQKALTGLSTKSDGGQRGYGIRTTTEIVCEGLEGEILLASGNAAVHKRGEQPCRVVDLPTEWPGTAFIARPKQPDASFNYIQYVE